MTTDRCREIGWQARQEELHAGPDQPMIGPWHWEIHDHSMATLCGGGEDAMIGHIMSISPCEACEKRAESKEWVWGRCMTPSWPEARLMAAARELLDALRPLAALHLWRDAYPDSKMDFLTDEDLPFTLDEVRAARAAIAKATTDSGAP